MKKPMEWALVARCEPCEPVNLHHARLQWKGGRPRLCLAFARPDEGGGRGTFFVVSTYKVHKVHKVHNTQKTLEGRASSREPFL
jgi:hypothetical protein